MKRRPRAHVTVGSSAVNASDVRGLQRAWREGKLIPFLGAGVSLPHGVPAWRDLVVDLLFDHAKEGTLVRRFAPGTRRAIADWVADYVEYDLTILARVVKTAARHRMRRRGIDSRAHAEDEFAKQLREHLYPKQNEARPDGETTLTAVADLIAVGVRERRVPAVVTFNYDDLLEEELVRRRVPHHVITSGRRVSGPGIPIIHPHGLLPRKGDRSAGVVFTEEEYHRISESVFHWAVGEVVHHLRHGNALFLGLSMSDPNLRRLLDAAYVHGDVPGHWLVQRRRKLPRSAIRSAAQDMAGRIPNDQAASSSSDDLARALDSALRLAERFDRELHQSMGAKTIWLEDFADIPALLAAIRR